MTEPDAFALFSASLPFSIDGAAIVSCEARPWNGRRLSSDEVCLLALVRDYATTAAWLASGNPACLAQSAHEWLSEFAE
jgi:hypothetical protein